MARPKKGDYRLYPFRVFLSKREYDEFVQFVYDIAFIARRNVTPRHRVINYVTSYLLPVFEIERLEDLLLFSEADH